MNWNIITDSSCDLLPSTSPDGRIRLTSVPFTIRVGERDFVDDEHLDTLEMLSAMEQERSAGHTSVSYTHLTVSANLLGSALYFHL